MAIVVHFVFLGFGGDKTVKGENADRTRPHEAPVPSPSERREEAERKAQAPDQGRRERGLRPAVRDCKMNILLFPCFRLTKVVRSMVISA